MNIYGIIGIIAATLTTFGFVPQIVQMYRIKSSRDVSIITLIQFGTGTGMWTIYGFYLSDLIIIVANFISFLTIIITIIFYFRYSTKVSLKNG